METKNIFFTQFWKEHVPGEKNSTIELFPRCEKYIILSTDYYNWETGKGFTSFVIVSDEIVEILPINSGRCLYRNDCGFVMKQIPDYLSEKVSTTYVISALGLAFVYNKISKAAENDWFYLKTIEIIKEGFKEINILVEKKWKMVNW